MATLIFTGVITAGCGVLCALGYKEEVRKNAEEKSSN